MKFLKSVFALAAAVLLSPGSALAGGVTDTEVLVGSITPLSGPAAIWGVGSTKAAQIRFDEANAAGGVHGRQIRFVIEDSQYQVPLAVRAVNKLIERDDVFALFAVLGTPHNLAIKERAFSENVPLLMPFSLAEALQTPQEPLKITWGSSYYDQTRQGIRDLHEANGRNNVCILYQDTEYGEEVLRATEDETEALGLEIVTKADHKPNATEFTGTLTGFKSAGCNLVVMGTVIRDTIIGYKTGQALGMEADFVTTAAGVDTTVSASGTDGLYGYGVTAMPAEAQASEFFAAYEASTKDKPGFPALLGYIMADLLVEALNNAGRDLTPESLITGFEVIQDHANPFGVETSSYSADNHRGPNSIVPMIVEGGNWVQVSR